MPESWVLRELKQTPEELIFFRFCLTAEILAFGSPSRYWVDSELSP